MHRVACVVGVRVFAHRPHIERLLENNIGRPQLRNAQDDRSKAADLAIWAIERPAELAYRIGFNPLIGLVKDGSPAALAPSPASPGAGA